MCIRDRYLRLDKDFQEKPLVKNVQCESVDTSAWLQGSLNYYTTENFDQMNQTRRNERKTVKTDAFGNPIEDKMKYQEIFNIVPPHKGLRFERNKMALTEKHYDEAKKLLPLNEKLSKSSLRFEWKEDTSKQSYDRFEIKTKINQEGRPFIKSLEQRRSGVEKPLKIGRENPSLLYTEKQLLLKIGHPDSLYTLSKS
eukprot:TRINITY_DN19167_c0_g1_i1.p1 TRINITY_DN19167_c0_g1~~TRINITY_DN19167_c0_g1_i1.p1  ORF type:complete len:197 (-),score=22.10 TRINITY_DN19167_c0_g1_i1:110-700(-)